MNKLLIAPLCLVALALASLTLGGCKSGSSSQFSFPQLTPQQIATGVKIAADIGLNAGIDKACKDGKIHQDLCPTLKTNAVPLVYAIVDDYTPGSTATDEDRTKSRQLLVDLFVKAGVPESEAGVLVDASVGLIKSLITRPPATPVPATPADNGGK